MDDGRSRIMSYVDAYTEREAAKERMRGVRHTPRPEGYNWYTIKTGGAWRDACADCPMAVAWSGGRWRHVR